jgi:hypothetical protein
MLQATLQHLNVKELVWLLEYVELLEQEKTLLRIILSKKWNQT